MSDDQEFPAQQQDRPGHEGEMDPEPQDEMRHYQGSGKLDGKVALVTGGDSGIGRAVAVAFAKEGADVAIAYLEEHDDAEHTASLVRDAGRRCVLLPGDLGDAAHARDVADSTKNGLGGLDLLVNNVAYQQPQDSPEDISDEQWLRTF